MKKEQGFTLIELIAVVVILGFLAATAIPKFMNATDDAKEASIEGVAGGISSAIGLVRAEWELTARNLTASIGGATANAAPVIMDGTTIWVNNFGYPFATGTATPTSITATVASCELIFDNILHNGPTSTAINTELSSRYFVSLESIDSTASCVYHLISSLDQTSGDIGTPTTGTGQGFYYVPSTGRVIVFGI